MKVVIIDNYDSFTFNLYQYCGEILNKRTLSGQNEIIVKRNDEITVKNLENFNPDKIIISLAQVLQTKKNILVIARILFLN